MRTWYGIILIGMISMFVGCSSTSPTDNLVNPTSESALNQWNTTWIIYDDEIKTGGKDGRDTMYPTADGQSLDFNYFDNDNAYDPLGKRCIKYSWDGSGSASYRGFSLTVAKSYESTSTAKDISPGAYKQLSFSIKGYLSTDTWIVVQGPADGTNTPDTKSISASEIQPGWQRITFPLTHMQTHLNAITTFLSVTFEYRRGMDTHGSGGTVYIDDITLTQ